MRSDRVLPCLLACCSLTAAAQAQQSLHFTYLWHMEQPIYWPDRQASGADRYERAWESILRTDAGAAHPENNLRDIFGLADRQAGYQYRMRDAINLIRSAPEAGAQISYSGGLIENISSLGNANQLGYSPSWFNSLREARSWTTTNGSAKPRADIVLFPFHHPLLPLCDDNTVRKEIQIYKAIYPDAWGTGTPISRGLFPSEMAFSTRLIPMLAAEGVEWSFISAEKISRACADFPTILGSGGVNTDPPNKADQLNPAQGASNYYRVSISRGCAPAEAYPFSLTPRRARWIDPNTGASSSIIVVPCSQSLGWKDGYAPLGTSDFAALNTRNDPSRPMLIVLAHDGDNAWGGGYSYYMEATPNLVSTAQAQGYTATTVERYLNDHPVPANDFVHVEDGAWVNADGDFGAPSFLNWNWPLLNATGQIDIPNGWHEDARNWAVITAAQNRVDTAEQIFRAQGNTIDPRKIVYPESGANAVERAWHYFLGSLNSGYMYYGTAVDMEVKPTIACNNAMRLADPVIASATPTGATSDTTPPTIWYPQRHPWNPGTTNFGPQYGYQQAQNNGDFYVWTFAYDASGIPDGNVKLRYRLDLDGQRTLANTENETFAGGPGVSAWQELTMTKRVFPAGNVYNNPTINFYAMPNYIADQYYVQLTGIRSKLVDYYIEATDAKGNVKRSPIMHVWVGDGSGAGGSTGGGTTSPVTIAPAAPSAGQQVTISYNPAGRVLAGATTVKLHWGINGWTNVPAVDPAMTLDTSVSPNVWKVTITLPTSASALDVVFNNGASTWDNNSGADWHFPVTGGVQPFVIDGTLDASTTLLASNGSSWLRAALQGSTLYVATPNTPAGNDRFIFLAGANKPLRAAQWGKAGQVAGWDAFIGAESSNAFVGWFDFTAGTSVAVAKSSVIEGTIDLNALFAGNIPSRIYLATAQWPTADGTSLIPSLQVPAGNGNSTLEATEYIAVDLCSLRATGCCPADVAQLGGALGRDGQLTVDDVLAFLAAFFGGNTAVADVARLGGALGPDGQLTVDDVLTFLTVFFAGCP